MRDQQRTGRDSNPRRGCPLTGFRDRLLQPLGHLSRLGEKIKGLSPAQEEPLQQLPALFRHQPADDFGPMVGPGITKEIVDRSRHPTAGIIGPEHHPSHFGQHNGTGALGARLQRDIQGGHRQTIFAYPLQSLVQRDDLRVRGRIPPLHRLIVGLPQDLSVGYDHGTDRHLFPYRRRPGEPERGLHAGEIAGRRGTPTH